MLFEDLIKNTPYDMAEVRVRAEGVFRVLKSRKKNKQESNSHFCREDNPRTGQKKLSSKQPGLEQKVEK